MKQQSGYILSQRDEAILSTIGRNRYTTVEQITWLHFSPSSSNHAGECLKKLTQEGYLLRFRLPHVHIGNAAYVYMLSTQGVKYLTSLGQDVPALATHAHTPGYSFIDHSLAVNAVLISATLLSQSNAPVTLYQSRSEWELKQHPLLLPQAQKKHKQTQNTGVVADAWLDFRYTISGSEYQTATWVEVDLGTEAVTQLRARVRGMVTAIQSGMYEKRFHTREVTIAFLAPDQQRLAQLRAWVGQELDTLHRRDYAELFLFTTARPLPCLTGQQAHRFRGHDLPAEISTFFLQPVWTTLTGSTLPLLDLRST